MTDEIGNILGAEVFERGFEKVRAGNCSSVAKEATRVRIRLVGQSREG